MSEKPTLEKVRLLSKNVTYLNVTGSGPQERRPISPEILEQMERFRKRQGLPSLSELRRLNLPPAKEDEQPQ